MYNTFMKIRIISVVILVLATALAFFVLQPNKINQEGVVESTFPFKFGLDLVGGSYLVYKADISEVDSTEVDESMKALQNVLERRLNPVGTSEVQVRTESASVFAENSENEHRVIIEIPNVQDPQEAKDLIGLIPLLEFKLQRPFDEIEEALTAAGLSSTSTQAQIEASGVSDDIFYTNTELTGRYVEKASVAQDQITRQPVVLLNFSGEGKDLFADLTKENVGNVMAIILDGEVISAPVIRDVIYDGNVQISGQFNIEEAQELARNLNYGALPVPIELISTQTISESLGADVLATGIKAALFGIICVMIFLIVMYRVGGVVASISLVVYVVTLLSLFKLFGFVFTAAGIAGFIISIGMAVDANILIFERVREELTIGKQLREAVTNGFSRAWLSIRDSNLSSIITALILFYLTSSLVQGFALAFGIGVIVSMFTAITITRTFLAAITPAGKVEKKVSRFYRKNLVGSLLTLTINSK